jgi:hypothetical protein
VLRSIREGLDTSNASGRMMAGVVASLAELELELGHKRRSASREARRARGSSSVTQESLMCQCVDAALRWFVCVPICKSRSGNTIDVGFAACGVDAHRVARGC